MLKALIFDVDGTLAETEEYHRRAFNAAFAAAGQDVEWTVDQYCELLKVTGGKERIAAYFERRGAPLAPERIAQLHAVKNTLYARQLADGAAGLRPGVQRLLREAASARLKLGIATTTTPVNLDALLRPLLGPKWASRFAAVVAGDEVARKKPAPDVYRACLERLALEPGEAVAIEDSAAGVAAASAAGLAVVATPSLYTSADDFSAADAVVPHLGGPQDRWEAARPGFVGRWVTLGDLAALAARRISPRAEMAQ